MRMKELSVSALILAFLISGCASINNSVPETQTTKSETTILASTESPTETAETKIFFEPTNEGEGIPFNPVLDPLFFLYGFVVGTLIGAVAWLLIAVLLIPF